MTFWTFIPPVLRMWRRINTFSGLSETLLAEISPVAVIPPFEIEKGFFLPIVNLNMVRGGRKCRLTTIVRVKVLATLQ